VFQNLSPLYIMHWLTTSLRPYFLSALLLCGGPTAATLLAAEPARPNFIVINIDDLGYGDIGPFGSTTKTPHLDRMAAEGMKLTSHYAAPVCSPSRAALLTGCYPKRSLPIPHVLFPASAVGLHSDEVTIAEILKEAGYATGCIGKWHLGDQLSMLPTRQGFDMYFGIPYSNDMGPPGDGSKSNPGRPMPMPGAQKKKNAEAKNAAKNKVGQKKAAAGGRSETGITGAAQPPLPLVENEQVIERVRAAEQTTLTERYTDQAVKFIREHQDQPFFLYLPHTAVHFPLYPPESYRGKSGGDLLEDWVLEVDVCVGRVLDTLRELKLDGRTLVIFTSDNGGSLPHGSNNGPLRGSKGSTFEGGIRTPTIAWWPGHVPAGTSTAAITSMMDILPTLAARAGAKVPADRRIDGVDQWPVLSGQAGEKPPRDHFFYFRGLALEAVRSGPWKLRLVPAGQGANAAQRAEPFQPQLYNLDDDLGEMTDIAAKHPDVVERLTALAATMKDDLGWTGLGPGCRPLGRVDNPLPMISADGIVRADAAGSQRAFP
jgi:arylsulfatase A